MNLNGEAFINTKKKSGLQWLSAIVLKCKFTLVSLTEAGDS